MSRTRLIILLLTMGTLAVYFSASHYGFSNFDDDVYVSQNFVVQSGLTWTGIQWAFTTWHASNWHPLTWISFELSCQMFGLNAGTHHLVNILFHAANTILLFILLLRWLNVPEKEKATNSFWVAAFVAALFAWHPLHVESVAWIAERKDVLSTFFALLTLLSYTKYAKENSRRSFWFALIFFTLALLSKPMFVTLPFLMLLLDGWPLERFKVQRSEFSFKTVSKLVIEKIPFLLLVVGSCVLTFLAQHHGGMVVSLEKLPLGNRLANVPLAYMDYLSKIFWPAHLAIFYPLPKSFSISAITIAFAVLISISIAVWLARKTYPYFLIGWLWFLGMLVPVIGIVQVGDALIADRYTYFPSIGIFLAITMGITEVVKRFRLPTTVLGAPAILILAACLLLTHRQLDFWRNDITLFSHALKIAPQNSALHLCLGLAFDDTGQKTNALAEYETAVKLTPNWSRAHGALANSLAELQRPEVAVAEFREALRLEPNHVPLLNNFGALLAQLGRLDEAKEQYSQSMQIDPAGWQAPFLMAQTLLKQGRDAEAILFLQKALQLDSNNTYILEFLSQVLASDSNSKIRDGQTALLLAQKANKLSGGIQTAALDTLAMADAETGNFADAEINLQNALNFASISGITNDVAALQQRLELYKAGKPFRQSFTEMPKK